MTQINERVQLLNDKAANNDGKFVLYWMQMFKRTTHNHSLNFAIHQANERKVPLVVYEGLKFYYPWANDRIHTFILEGVEEKRKAFAELGIHYIFYLQQDENSPKDVIANIAKDACLIVTDDFPCFIIPKHNQRIAQKAEIPVYQVDSNGMIPMSRFEKEEYAAYTIRPKIKRMLPEYWKCEKDEKVIVRAENLHLNCPENRIENIPNLVKNCAINHSVKASSIYKGGSSTAKKRLQHFIKNIFPEYAKTRNECSVDGSSRLSPYLHFGFLSVYEIVEAVENADVPQESKEAFLEELIVRRELAYNFTRFNPNYNSLKCLPAWTQETIRKHANDRRDYLYSIEDLENFRTHDEIWNAAQRELVQTGGMHNYVRMLWGKNVIAWTRNYEEAFAILEDFNNKYALDGRNPNSYAGILWCFGKHDRPWFERPVFGTIRYMTSGSSGKKFNSKKYIEWTKSFVQPSLF
ncbi:MAG: deoxyribodipyrimidine photo-lyase [Pyrinomonadaceae bacterium]|nr:deoxyribodipyrimidine photo-lyase [Pyrinomonadaceae bacterium]